MKKNFINTDNLFKLPMSKKKIIKSFWPQIHLKDKSITWGFNAHGAYSISSPSCISSRILSFFFYSRHVAQNRGNYRQYFIDLNQIYCSIERVAKIYILSRVPIVRWGDKNSFLETILHRDIHDITSLNRFRWRNSLTICLNHPYLPPPLKTPTIIFPRHLIQPLFVLI